MKPTVAASFRACVEVQLVTCILELVCRGRSRLSGPCWLTATQRLGSGEPRCWPPVDAECSGLLCPRGVEASPRITNSMPRMTEEFGGQQFRRPLAAHQCREFGCGAGRMNPHQNFRLFLTMEFNPKIPANLIRLWAGGCDMPRLCSHRLEASRLSLLGCRMGWPEVPEQSARLLNCLLFKCPHLREPRARAGARTGQLRHVFGQVWADFDQVWAEFGRCV